MSEIQTHPQLLQFLTAELRQTLIEQAESVLLKIVRTNIDTQYASKSSLLAKFRDAVSEHGSASDTELVDAFRHCIPLSDYAAYKPFMTAFEGSHCKEAEVENLFAPGLPYLLAISSATSGKEPKIFPKYYPQSIPSPPSNGPVAAVVLFCGYRELKYVEREPGQIVKKIPVSNVSSGTMRAMLRWFDVENDASRMAIIPPGFVAPFAACMIANHKSFLTIHGLFTLACRGTDRMVFTFSTLFCDLVQFLDEQWDMLLSSIRDGVVPDLPGVHEFHAHLQLNFDANPERAAELGEIGPPSSCEGWAARVWPKLKTVQLGCSGPFASVLPKIKAIIGPTIAIYPNRYGSSECMVARPYRPDDILHRFVLRGSDLIEFLNITATMSPENLLQAWELDVGEQYEVVVTTRDGLWRYQLGDIIEIAGFDPSNGFPVCVLSGRKSLSIRLSAVLILDSDIISSLQGLSPDIMHVNEFTTVPDIRRSPDTVGYLIEPAGALGPNAHLAFLRLSEGLAAANNKFRAVLHDEEVRKPTVRILRPGTFAAFRQWKAEALNIVPGQLKVPVILLDEVSTKWLLDKVVTEL